MEESLWSLIPPNSLFRAKAPSGEILTGVRFDNRAGWVGNTGHSFPEVGWDSAGRCRDVVSDWESWVRRRLDEGVEPIAILAENLTGEEDGPAQKALVDKYEAELTAKMTPACLDDLKWELLRAASKLDDRLKRADGTLEELIVMMLQTTEMHGMIDMIESGDLSAIRQIIGYLRLVKRAL